MLDDIPNNFTSQFSSFSSEGKMHASLLSNLYLEFQKKKLCLLLEFMQMNLK